MTETVQYLIIGGGMTADAAVRGVRTQDPDGSIVLLSEEDVPPHDRPPLSKGLWQGEELPAPPHDLEAIDRRTADAGARILTGTRAVELDPGRLEVLTDRGHRIRADRILLATGSRPRTLPDETGSVLWFRTLQDCRRLAAGVRDGARVALVGGGFIGCELAGSLAARGIPVDQIFPEEAPLADRLPLPFAHLLADQLDSLGATLRPGHAVTAFRGTPGALRIETDEGILGPSWGLAVAGLGVIPRQELAEEAGLEVRDGIVVNEALETSAPGVFAAGDVIRFPAPRFGEQLRIEHEDHANDSGRIAGSRMAGATERYDPIPYVYSGIGGITLEEVGVPAGGDPDEILVPTEAGGRGFALWQSEGRLRRLLVWNRPGRAPRIRRLLRDDPAPPTDQVVELLAL